MSTAPHRRSMIAVATVLLALVLGLGAPAHASAARAPSAAAALRTLVGQTRALPASAVGAGRRNRLIGSARRARGSARRAPCRSVTALAAYRRVLKSTRLRRSVVGRTRRARRLQQLARLNASSVTASRSLLASRKTRRCGGGTPASTRSSVRTQLLRSDADGLKVRVQLPRLEFVAEQGGGRTYTRLAARGLDSAGAVGSPGVPVSSALLGVPDGAEVAVSAANVTAQTLRDVELYPVQREPVDQATGVVTTPPDFGAGVFAARPFTLDRKAYAKGGLSPGPTATPLGQARDLNLAGLRIPAAQYDPRSDTLRLIRSVDVTVRFSGGDHAFTDRTGSPWEPLQDRLVGALLNAGAVGKRPGFTVRPCGEELLVITNPATRPAADTYAVARQGAGLRTAIAETGTGAGQIGTSAAQIQSFIRGRVVSPFCVRPSYVTILGDDKLVPTFTGVNAIPSDLPYALKNDADELPDVAVGRIFGEGLEQVSAAVAKILHYETSPPTGSMLNKAVVAAQFQDTDAAGQTNDGIENRTFIQFAETVRNGLSGRGVAVDRVYHDEPTSSPLKFNDGTDLPAALRKPAFAWNGTGADVSAAWNAGRFLVVHRDHGWSDGWSTPTFTTADVDGLTNSNDALPVVMSINCSSAAYDYDDTSFAQNALTKVTGGAVGVFGDTRNSPSTANSQIALGFVDGLLPYVLPAEGPVGKLRTGDALIHGKLRLAGIAPPSGPGISGGSGSTRDELYLWHYFGDPTMQMWGGDGRPKVFDRVEFTATYQQLQPPKPGDPPPFVVVVNGPLSLAGQAFSVLRNGQVIGKAFADAAGRVEIPATFDDGTPAPGELAVAIEGDGAAPIVFGVDGVPAPPAGAPPAPTPPPPTTATQPPPPPPPPPPTATALTQNCPGPNDTVAYTGTVTVTMTGRLAGAPAGSEVTVTFKHPDTRAAVGRTETVKVKTDAAGNWSASVTSTTRSEAVGTWQVSSAYAGTSQYQGSSAAACPVVVFDNS